MASRRKLKKQINNSFELLYNDCILYKVFAKNANVGKADEIIVQITELHTDLLKRVNISEGKDVKARVKNYYKKLNEDLKSKIDKIGLDIQGLD